ncbi:DUF3990 domain-containing protein [bacterium 1XD8-76]|nr:DUF3990 domain-containing protein [bacterium 1XD8-76]
MCRKIERILYHGTASQISQVNVKLGRGRKDFGKGFYMAVSKRQAIGMMHKKYKEAVRRSREKREDAFCEKLYEIVLDEKAVSELNIKVFERADIEWLDFVLMCRERGGLPHNYDMVIGPTADDDTMFCLKAYWDGLYGRTGSDTAKRMLLNNLETENLGIQYFIGKQKVADNIIVSIKECDWR